MKPKPKRSPSKSIAGSSSETLLLGLMAFAGTWYSFHWLPQKAIASVIKLTIRKSSQVFNINYLLLSFISLFQYNLLTHAKLPLPPHYLPTVWLFLFRVIFIQLSFAISSYICLSEVFLLSKVGNSSGFQGAVIWTAANQRVHLRIL